MTLGLYLRLIVFMRLLRHSLCLMLLVVVCGLKYGQNRPPNERQSLFDKGSVNTEKWGPAPNKRFSGQEVDSVKY